MVLDHVERVPYTTCSHRSNAIALERFCTHFNFEPMAFPSADAAGSPIYHTNVMMCIATDFALVGLNMITDAARRSEIHTRLLQSGREVIVLENWQIAEFAGNAIELSTETGRILAMSARAKASLNADQISLIEHSACILPLSVPTIEMAGGSVRCMLAGIHLTRR